MRVWVLLDYGFPGSWYYSVIVDGDTYDRFSSTKRLLGSEQRDIAAGYQEALEGYVAPN